MVESVDLGLGNNIQVVTRQVSKAFGGLDVIIVVPASPVEVAADRLSDSAWSQALGRSLGAVFYATRALARESANRPVEGGPARLMVLLPPAGMSGVAVALLAAVEALISGLAAEWRDKRIIVNGVKTGETLDEAAVLEKVRWLISDQASGVSGQVTSLGN